LFRTKCVKHSHHITDVMKQGVLVDRFWSVGLAVAAHIGGNDVKSSGCERR
jgi:hypothetical protein